MNIDTNVAQMWLILEQNPDISPPGDQALITEDGQLLITENGQQLVTEG